MSKTYAEDRIEVSLPGFREKVYAYSGEFFESEVMKYFNVSDISRNSIESNYEFAIRKLEKIKSFTNEKTLIVIDNFENYISCLRSREVSFTLVLQSESQLVKLYGPSAHTIVSNCAWYLFLGSGDLQCCQEIAKRMNVPLDRVLYKARDEVFIIGNFSRPRVDTIYDLRMHEDYCKLENEKFHPCKEQ